MHLLLIYTGEFRTKNAPIGGIFQLNQAKLLTNSTASNSSSLSSGNIASYNKDIFSHSILVAILICFALGVLLAFTPCILPMIPILSAIILGQKDIKTSKSFGLSLTYVLGMALTYTALGVLVSLLGYNFQAQLQGPGFLISLAALFVKVTDSI